MRRINNFVTSRIHSTGKIGLSALSILAITLFTFSNSFANENLNRSEKKITRQITNILDYPASILSDDEDGKDRVILYFQVDQEGMVEVYWAEGSNEELITFVESELDGKKLDYKPDDEIQKFMIPIRFRSI